MTVPPPDANAAPRVCLIVVAYNSAAVIGDLLHSLREDEPAGYVRDVVVVDNASSDETVRVVEKEFPAALVIRNARNVGFGAANNIGAATEPGRRADYLAFVNPDVVVTRGWLTPLLEALQQRPELASVQPLILEGANGNRINSGGNRLHYLGYGSVGEYGQAAPPASGVVRECAYSSGCACVFRAADFRAVGGFD